VKNIWKLLGGITAIAMLIVAFGFMPSNNNVVQAAVLTVVPVSTTDVATENTRICAVCGGDDSKFLITVTDAAANTATGSENVVTVSVKNLELGTLGTAATPDSNAKTISLTETGHNTGVFTRVVQGVNITASLQSNFIDSVCTGGTTTTCVAAATLSAANLRDPDESGLVGAEVQVTGVSSGAPDLEVQVVGAYNTNGTLTFPAVTVAVAANDTIRTYFKNVNVPVFSGQTLEVTYAATGQLGQSAKVYNDEVKPTIIVTSPAENYITKKGTTITFSADITDATGGAGFPAKAQDVVDNATANTKGRIELYVGTGEVPLTAANFTAIDNGWRVSATYNSTDIQGIAKKVPWWVVAEDLAGRSQEPSNSFGGITTSAGAGNGTTIVDTALASLVANTLVGRTLSITIGGVAQVRAVTGYNTNGTITNAAFTAQIATNTNYTVLKTLLVTVDGTAPALASGTPVVTGEGWSSALAAGSRVKTGLSASRTSIRVAFTDDSGLDSTTVVPSAFTVAGNTVEAVLLVDTVGENAAIPSQRVPNTVFLTLGTDLASDGKPNVTVASSVKDKAGNAYAGSTTKATDTIGPKLAVSLDKTLSNSKITATITSDELLVSAPTVTYKGMSSATLGTLVAMGTAPTGGGGSNPAAPAQTGEKVYTSKLLIANIGTGNEGAKINIYVSANDTGASGGTAGATGHASDGTKAAALTVQMDQMLNAGNSPKVTVGSTLAEITTESASGVPSIEAVDPLIVTADFTVGCTAGDACAGLGEGTEYIRDSYKTVELTSASVKVTFADGTSETTTFDVATDVTSPDNKKFTIPMAAPKIGTYVLTLKAKDSAGNIALDNELASAAQSLQSTWKVTAALPVSLAMSPGWNLISLPFQPASPAINSVIPSTHPADLVMAYDNANAVWLVSRRNSTSGLFDGDVKMMTSNTAYFVRSTNFSPLSLLRPPLATSAAAPPPPPAIDVVVGWNLVPVVSNSVPLPTEIASDTYFGTLGTNWLKAMTYNPLTRTWQSVTRAVVAYTNSTGGNVTHTDDCGVVRTVANLATVAGQVCVGKGYWLYASKAGVVIP